MQVPFLSLILPTRGRPDGLARFLGSLAAHTVRRDAVEVILVMDDDDPASIEFQWDESFRVVRRVVPRGQTMGQLNTAGYEVSTGTNVMLVNDDIVVQTPGWDEQVFTAIRNHPDGVFLVHVNDGIFQERLCTFPLVSRRFCELAGSICPPEYRRYRIDDHIYNVFNLLSVLGKNRILYLPDVRFEHHNFVQQAGGAIEYQPDPVIHDHDTKLFDARLDGRKDLAVALLREIERHQWLERNNVKRESLEPITDSVSLRRPEYVRRIAPYLTPSSNSDRVTVAVVTADATGEYARACIGALKTFTSNFDLLIVDNNRSRGFNHAREMNRVLDGCRTDFLVLLDDDVIVEAGWLDRLLAAMGSTAGVVTPCHKDIEGRLSYAGVVMRPDGSGHHSHSFRISPQPFRIQTLCSAAVMVDMAKCGSIRFDERYSKYFLDIDYGLRVWEAGYEVLCVPSAMVTHIGGATLKYGSDESTALFEAQREQFVRKWIETGRYDAIAWTRWQGVPELASLLEIPAALHALIGKPTTDSVDEFLARAHQLFDSIRGIPDLQQWVVTQIDEAVGRHRPTLLDPDRWHLACLLGFTDCIVTIERERHGYDIVLSGGEYFALPVAASEVNATTLRAAESKYLRAGRIDVLKALIEANVASAATIAATTESGPRTHDDRDSRRWLRRSPLKHAASIDGFDVFAFEFKFFAVPQEHGPFEYDRYIAGGYPQCVVGHSIPEIRQKISLLRRDDRVLVLTPTCPPTLRRSVGDLLAHGNGTRASVLSGVDLPAEWNGRLTPLPISGTPAEAIQSLGTSDGEALVDALRREQFTRVLLSWDEPGALKSAALEQVAARIAPAVEVVFPDGVHRRYSGEDAHRLVYNKAYIASMFSVIPPPAGREVLEIGCSDGLVCDMMSHLGAPRVTGIDVMATTGCAYRSDTIQYYSMDATRLTFPDASFELAYSIATFEHLPRPKRTLDEMVRVLRVGGIGYVQAGPLYYSPFGHHMFAYFGDQPWIHLRRSKKRILGYATKRGIDKRIAEDLGITLHEYLDQMLSADHINGFPLPEYGLDAFRRRNDITVLKFNVSREGEDLLTPAIRAEIGDIPATRLTEHGFEILFRRTV